MQFFASLQQREKSMANISLYLDKRRQKINGEYPIKLW